MYIYFLFCSLKKIEQTIRFIIITIIIIVVVILAVISFDEQAESLTTSGFLTMGWTDNGLQWNTSQYGGLTQIFVVRY